MLLLLRNHSTDVPPPIVPSADEEPLMGEILLFPNHDLFRDKTSK